jgi:peptidylprolyl isomerase
MTNARSLILIGVLVGTLASCGTDSATPASHGTQSPSSTIPTLALISTPTTAGRFGTRPPLIKVGMGGPPSVLEGRDLIVGNGQAVKSGNTVTVQYEEGNYLAPRTVFDTTWGHSPFTFTVGESQVIRGWDEGIVGMRVGGRRELIIPPSLAYGAQTNFTIVLVIDLLRIDARRPTPTTTVPTPETTVETAHLGGSLNLTAVVHEPSGAVIGSQSYVESHQNPAIAETERVSVTLNHLIDPAPASLSTVNVTPAFQGSTAPIPGDRWVELEFAVTNESPAPFVDQEGSYNPSLSFAVDNASTLNEKGAQPEPTQGYEFLSTGPGTCSQFLVVPPGATEPGCVGFQVPVGVPIVIASVALNLNNSPDGSLGEWLVP